MFKINNLLIFSISFILITVFIFEIFYLLPSQTGDSSKFVNIIFNICRYNEFKSYGDPRGDIFDFHGWLHLYIISKLNYNCSIENLYLINYFLKIITLIFSYLLLKDKFNTINLFIILFFVYVAQIKLQFRPESICILLSSLIFYYHKKENYVLIPILFGFLLNSHIVFFTFLSLIFLLSFWKIYLKKKVIFKLIAFFLITLILLEYIYPYTIYDYIYGNISKNSGTWSTGESFNINQFNQYYILNKIHGSGPMPLLGIGFLFIAYLIFKKKKILLILAPLFYFFSLRNLPGNYYVAGLTPILVMFSYFIFENKEINHKKSYKFFFIIILISALIGFGHYFIRNSLTIFYFNNDFNKTKEFLNNNLNKIDKFPSFGTHLNKEIIYENYSVKNCSTCNLSDEIKNYDLKEANGSINICENSKDKNDYSIKLFGMKIFNSNSGYGIYICEKKISK